MSGRFNEIQSVSKNEEGERNNMLDLWRTSIERVIAERRTVQTPAKSGDEMRADLEQRVRNGEIACASCAMREHAEAGGKTATQAPGQTGASPAGEGGRGFAGSAGARAGGAAALEYAKCPECGRSYVKSEARAASGTRPADKRTGRVVDTRA